VAVTLYENASILSVDARGSRLRVQVGRVRRPPVALSDLPRAEHLSSAVPRAASICSFCSVFVFRYSALHKQMGAHLYVYCFGT
jgi:hypothetical protein